MPVRKQQLTEKAGFVPPFWLWPLFFLLFWEVLLLAQNPGLMSDDSGEMAAAAYQLGLPHPPGYPLLDLLGRIFTLLPLGTVAFRLNLLSALLTLFSLGITLQTCRRLGRRLSGGTLPPGPWMEPLLLVTAVSFLSCRSVFAQSLTAKGCVYTLTLFLGAGLLGFLFSPKIRSRSLSIWFLLLFLWSLGAAHHWQTVVLWLPLLGLWARRNLPPWKGKAVLFSVSILLLGLSPYLYLPLRASQGVLPCWGHPTNTGGFVWVVSRRLVAGLEPWVQKGDFYLGTLEEFGRIYGLYWFPVFSVLALAGAVLVGRRDRAWGEILLAFFLPVFLAVFLIHQSKNIYLIHAYLVPLACATALFGFGGLAWTHSALRKSRGLFWGLVFLAGLGSLGWLARVFNLENKGRYTLAEDFGTNVLRSLPEGALLLADGDHYVMPVWYEKYVRARRPDVIFEPSVFLYHDWGWRQLRQQSPELGALLDSDRTFQGRLNALARRDPGHPFCYSLGRDYLEPLLERMPGAWVPHGLVFEWEPRPPKKGDVPRGVGALVQGERERGLDEFWAHPGRDFSSTEIYRYYAYQHDLTHPRP